MRRGVAWIPAAALLIVLPLSAAACAAETGRLWDALAGGGHVALMRHALINCHPLVNTMTISLARADLLRFLEATGHPPRILPIADDLVPAGRASSLQTPP